MGVGRPQAKTVKF